MLLGVVQRPLILVISNEGANRELYQGVEYQSSRFTTTSPTSKSHISSQKISRAMPSMITHRVRKSRIV